MAPVVLVSELPGARGGLALAAGCAVAMAGDHGADEGAVLLVEVGGGRSRGPTMLASQAARELEARMREAGFDCAARGRLAWLRTPAEPGLARGARRRVASRRAGPRGRRLRTCGTPL